MHRHSRIRPAGHGGFTLVEMAVVLVIIGLIILTVFPALMVSRSSSQRSLTQSNLQALMTATAAYVQANGCVPCPTPANTTLTGFGKVRGSTDAAPAACGVCTVPEGIPPFASLGIPAGVAHDGWGHWITMRVDPALTNPANLVTPPTKPVACTCPIVNGACAPTPTGSACTCGAPVNGVCTPLPAGVSQQGLCAAGLPKTNSVSVVTPRGATQSAAIIFVAHGTQGRGSYIAAAVPSKNGINGCRLQFPTLAPGCPQALTCGDTVSDEGALECNASGTATFVNAQPSSIYDDVLAFADRNALVAMMSGGAACQSSW